MQRRHDPTDIVVDEGYHTVVIHRHMPQLFVGLLGRAGYLIPVLFPNRIIHCRDRFESRAMPPRPLLQVS